MLDARCGLPRAPACLPAACVRGVHGTVPLERAKRTDGSARPLDRQLPLLVSVELARDRQPQTRGLPACDVPTSHVSCSSHVSVRVSCVKTLGKRRRPGLSFPWRRAATPSRPLLESALVEDCSRGLGICVVVQAYDEARHQASSRHHSLDRGEATRITRAALSLCSPLSAPLLLS